MTKQTLKPVDVKLTVENGWCYDIQNVLGKLYNEMK